MRMLLNPTPTMLIMLILGVLAFIFMMLLPALLEVKKPKDAGPRTIMGNIPITQSGIRETALIANVEEEYEFDRTFAKEIADVIAVLPNLEA